ncbi:hypothetical protein NLX83_24570 [Allokutzneria sp. A3M-2-11 16]|uniref:hypothetical protein n=1 Tax=Allokutzneria sp. A3M-2-11 16 TaxID=2962043 RepID=UPI0020B6F878|nr:hypothetical protein [Allokutzneria sp. A3M-2-11 16]MCP3802448.1 hypothetical protein [Allokutzneria sp. A3M-2-11 16]
MEPNTDIDRLQELPETEPEPGTTTGPGDPGVVRPYTSQTLHIGAPEPEQEPDLDEEFIAEFGDGEAAPEADKTAKA